MKTVRPISIAAFCLALTLGMAWGDAASIPGPASLVKLPTQESLPSAQPAERIDVSSGVYSEHLPLALFSLGSLAVGGVFYGINSSMQGTKVNYAARDRSQLTAAIGVAGLGALLAAGSYFYYVHHPADHPGEKSVEKEGDWDAQVTGGVSPGGDAVIGALLTLPLPSLSR